MNIPALASSGSGTRRYLAGSTETLYGRFRSGADDGVCCVVFECDEVTDRLSFLFVLVEGFYRKRERERENEYGLVETSESEEKKKKEGRCHLIL
jgi:hypothetical protein